MFTSEKILHLKGDRGDDIGRRKNSVYDKAEGRRSKAFVKVSAINATNFNYKRARLKPLYARKETYSMQSNILRGSVLKVFINKGIGR
jgi:hypothetical protein